MTATPSAPASPGTSWPSAPVMSETTNEEAGLRRRPRRRHSLALSIDSMESTEKTELLDFDLIRNNYPVKLIDNEYDDKQEEEENVVSKVDEMDIIVNSLDEHRPYPRLNIFVGIIRCLVFIGVAMALFAVALHIGYPSTNSNNEQSSTLWTYLVIVYVVSASFLLMIDAIGTPTFRWREYGELTPAPTDATSILFLFVKSRWTLRLTLALILLSVLTLRAPRILYNKQIFPEHTLYWFLLFLLLSPSALILGLAMSLCSCSTRRVPWLLDKFDQKILDDHGDIWRQQQSLNNEDHSNDSSNSSSSFGGHDKGLKSNPVLCLLRLVLRLLVTSIFALALVSSATIVYGLRMCTENGDAEQPELPLLLALTTIMTMMPLILLLFQTYLDITSIMRATNLSIIVLCPFPLCLVQHGLFINARSFDQKCDLPLLSLLNYFALYQIVVLMIVLIMETILASGRRDFVVNFFKSNYIWPAAREGSRHRKWFRLLYTLAHIFALLGLLFSFVSLMLDPYDVEISAEGVAKDVMEACDRFQRDLKPITSQLRRMVNTLDRAFTCKEVFQALGTGAAVSLFASFFPGASSIVQVGSRSAYYGVRAANSLTNLAHRLRRSKNVLWQVAKAVLVVQKFVIGNLKKVVVISNLVTAFNLLPLLPPFVLGIFVLFGAFWPKRLLFFSGKQRRKFMASQTYAWLMRLILLGVAVGINTALLDELVSVLDENLPLVKVELRRKLGFYVSLTSSILAMISCLIHFVSWISLKWNTFADHENLSNAEKEWKAELERRELVAFGTAVGTKIEKRTRLKYKKEHIRASLWLIPIVLATIACFLGILANNYPRLQFSLEPKGRMGRLIDRVHQQLFIYDNDRYDVANDTSRECLPYTSLHDVLKEMGYKKVLMRPLYAFFNVTEDVVEPLRRSFDDLSSRLWRRAQTEVLGDTLENIWSDSDLKNVKYLLMVPRILALFLLLFGCLTTSLFICQMRVIQALEPAKMVSAFGQVTTFSILYVLGSQVALYNVLSTLGVPFYELKVRFGMGFVYDVAADAVLMCTYIGMRNDFFFAIPKRKAVVVYTVPDVSDVGPNAQGQII